MGKANLITIAIVILAIACAFAFLGSIVNKVPTGNDAKASRVIYDEVLAMSQKAGLPIDQNHMYVRPRRGGAELIVHVSLSDKEKQTFSGFVEMASHDHSDRKISVKFQ